MIKISVPENTVPILKRGSGLMLGDLQMKSAGARSSDELWLFGMSIGRRDCSLIGGRQGGMPHFPSVISVPCNLCEI